ncbi:ATP-dependent DNA helicase RecQ [Streptomyces cinereoruber]|uniref:DNA 3'-5' helicase n=1 Tax=Streptomyces cinereoruber TaxID=67260 RepID=A0AAV4KQV3_9ACTN|nr:RecQ family ATP-dependent DNA helicase [Streptomyces cinereoruber]MBB4162227.1 ATP-dependent DNA helicase RecQ [Streptomyces cinereoruber]MBY8820252.1 RecQ family ATP-dependent DNA helicase [Streptomyces cinereoruber]NIH62616.1 ATP-dependent DNA helicase RecQ [Streptomyces cinereoruber]QEV35161.1 RecQ family ATP-dependent DNA helicase [Streptomyces cinereoruber]GGR49108.1 ATP-dependent DNA helicase RecQ [Streptomyces cinereoruber]
MDNLELRAEADAVLAELVGAPEGTARLREDQWLAVAALVEERRRALVVQRTGWGKSAVYFVATALLRRRGSGPTVIISPLLALMRNQVEAAERAGIRARTINSANPEEWETIYDEVERGETDVLLVSPERLNSVDFREQVLPKLAATTGLLVVDEAHCISDWGHDFRPDYRRLRTMLTELAPGVPVLATTATANARVTADVAEQLGTGAGEALVLRGSLERESLRLGVVRLPDAAHRLAWLAEHLDELPGSGIVYTLTVAAAEETTAFLRQRGFPVASYTGRTENADRLQAEADLQENRVKALVATSALGMGFDKPDLGFVIHLGSPSSPIAYYQQVGRAGRGVEHAEVLMLPGKEDEAIWRYFADTAFPPEAQVRQTLAALADAGRPLSVPALEAAVDLRRTRLETMLKVLDVDGAVRRVKGGWESTGRPWAYDTERYAWVARQRAAEQQAMRDYVSATGCRMEFLRRQLDDEGAAPCGRCDNCAGAWADASVSQETLTGATRELDRPGVEVEPRRMWPTGMPALGIELKGRIPAGEQCSTGRALGRLSDIGWGNRLRPLLAENAPDGPVPDDVLKAAVAVLADWARSPGGWAPGVPDASARPVGVVAVPSLARPHLVGSLARGIADIGRLPYLGTLTYTGPDGAHAVRRSNSAQRLRALSGAFAVSEELSAALAAAPGPVLLVDDFTDSGWTLAVAARLLRRAGAEQVLPLVLAAAG